MDRLGSLGTYIQVAAMLSHKSVRDVAFRVRWLNQGGRPGGRDKAGRSGAEASGRGRSAGGSRGGGGGGGAQAAAPRGKARPLVGGSAGLAPFSLLGGGPVGGSGSAADLMAGLSRGGGIGGGGGGFLLSGFDFPPLPGRPGPLSLRGASVGSTEELLHANGQLVELISARLAVGQAAESRQLLASLRENLVTVMHRMESEEGIMAQMPPLPVQPNLDLAERLLGPRQSADAHWH